MKNRIKVVPYEKAKFDVGEVCVDEVFVTYVQNGD